MAVDATGAGGRVAPLPERDILDGFDRLIAANRLFGAELNPTVIKKSGKAASFIVSPHPSRSRMLDLWREIFADLVSPGWFLDALSIESGDPLAGKNPSGGKENGQ